MDCYQTKTNPLNGTRVSDVIKEARFIYHQIEKRTRRRPYIRSAYFHKEKIFLDNFWPHLFQKSFNERAKRLRFLPCAIELIELSRGLPEIKTNPNNKNELLYRFMGKTRGNQFYYVQIKEDLKRKQKYLMSVFTK